jgi:8-oxo-dGTP diphosphatase
MIEEIKNNRENIKVGVGVMIFKDGKVLMGKRRGRHGDGEYSFTGGHLEYLESFEECAKKETLEETGINIKNIKFLCLANYCKYEDRQDVLVGLTAEWESGEPKDFPEERIGEWEWYNLDNLPTPIFYPSAVMLKAYKEGKNYYDKK